MLELMRHRSQQRPPPWLHLLSQRLLRPATCQLHLVWGTPLARKTQTVFRGACLVSVAGSLSISFVGNLLLAGGKPSAAAILKCMANKACTC